MRHAVMNRRSPLSRASSLLVLFALLVGMLPATSFAAPIVDAAVITDAAVTATFTVTGVPSGYTSMTASTWTNQDVTATIAATTSVGSTVTVINAVVDAVPQSSGTPPYSILVPLTAEGTHTIAYSATVDTGTVGETATETAYVRIDKTAPSTAATTAPIAISYNDTATLTFTANDNAGTAHSGVKNFEVTGTVGATVINTVTVGTGPISFTQVGSYSLHIRAVDNAGNKSAAILNISFAVGDNTPPTTSISGWSANWVSVNPTITLTGADTPGGSGFASMRYSIDGTSVVTTTASTVNIPFSTEGTTTLAFRSLDVAGIAEATQTVVIRIDKTKPVSTPAGVPAGWTSANTTVTISATDALSGVAKIWSAVDGSGLTSTTVGSHTLVVSTEGSHAVTFGAYDVAGNKEDTQTTSVRIDKTAPVSSTDATSHYVGTATVAITGTDTLSGVASSSWRLDGVGAFTVGATAMTSVAGTHTLEFFSTDNAGNAEAAKSVTFHVTGGAAYTALSAGGTLAYAAKGAVAGKLVDALTSSALASRTVTLQRSSNGVTFSTVATTTTGVDGSFAFPSQSMISKNKTWFRVQFAGDANYPAATSAFVVYTPKVKVATPSTKTRLRSYNTLKFTSTITPDHPSTAKSSTIAFERYKISKGKHIRRVRYYAKVSDKGSYSTLSRSFKLPKGTWYVRIYAKADSKHALTYSSARKLVIR